MHRASALYYIYIYIYLNVYIYTGTRQAAGAVDGFNAAYLVIRPSCMLCLSFHRL